MTEDAGEVEWCKWDSSSDEGFLEEPKKICMSEKCHLKYLPNSENCKAMDILGGGKELGPQNSFEWLWGKRKRLF